jgi:adenylate cyclase, class 2
VTPMPATTHELEIKLRADDADAARQLVAAAGAAPFRPRRLQRDFLLDTADGSLRSRRSVLRVRIEPEGAMITFKGPPQPSTMKLREEIETRVADGPAQLRILEAIGFGVWFRYEKYREEFAGPDVIIAVDETPVGVFIEIEGGHDGITAMARALGCEPVDYVLESYRELYAQWCAARGIEPADMLF